MPHNTTEDVFQRKDRQIGPYTKTVTLQEQAANGWPTRSPLSSSRTRDLRELTEYKVALLTGQDYWRTSALLSHGLPSIKLTDGPNGARGERFTNGTKAALFPCGASLAATWDLNIIQKVAQHIALETRARGADVLLAPTVCLHRTPLGGRNFESFSEDPFLTGKMATAYVRGLQSQGIGATMKHFVGNEQETDRKTSNSIISERALRELYLKPFEMTVRDCPPVAIMSGYHRVNGVHCDQNHRLLTNILRREWKFDGLVMSDWDGLTSSVASLLAGCDLEMPCSDKWRGKQLMGLLEERSPPKHRAQVDRSKTRNELRQAVGQSANRVVKLVMQTRGLKRRREEPERTRRDRLTAQVIYEAGVAGLTLLKNENSVLPLKRSSSVAVIGPNADRTVANGGGSASLNPEYRIRPLDMIKRHCSGTVRFAQGCDSWKWVPLASEYCVDAKGRPGVVLEYFEGAEFIGKSISTTHHTSTDLYLWDSAPESVRNSLHSFRVRTQIIPKKTGFHTIGFSSVGPGRLIIDGEIFIDNWNWTEAGEAMFGNSKEVVKKLAMTQGVPVDVVVESTNEIRPASRIPPNGPNHHYGGCRLGCLEPPHKTLLDEAVEAARASDVAVVIVGLDAEWESEGYDRRNMDLPKDGSQDRLISAIVKANPNTVVINQSGSPVTMPWADEVPAIMQAWYQGQEAANALADVLFGICSPSGRLPVTFPRTVDDSPAHKLGIVDNLDVYYEEDLHLGYRYFQQSLVKPLFCFGHGLSYTTFDYGVPELDRTILTSNNTLTLEVPIENNGYMAASEVVQVYVCGLDQNSSKCLRELKGFAKVFVDVGETAIATIDLDKHAVSYYSVERNAWVADAGAYKILVGASSDDIRRMICFKVEETFSWIF